MTMTNNDPIRLLLIQAFSMPPGADYSLRKHGATREESIMNYNIVAPLLEGVEWDVNPGPVSSHGTSLVETREEFLQISVGRLPIVRDACQSGTYNGIVLLGGGDPGFAESCEIAQRFSIPVTACANAQMHIASMLGSRFSVIDISEPHSVHYRNLVWNYGFADRCSSLRNLDAPLPREGFAGGVSISDERDAVAAGRTSVLLDAAVKEAEAAIEDDGAEVIIIGCSALYWIQPHLQRLLAERSWDIPVLEGYSCAIEMAKMKARLGLTVSGVAFPSAPALRSRRVKRF